MGQGESWEERQRMIQVVRRTAGPEVPLLAQSVDTLPEVRTYLLCVCVCVSVSVYECVYTTPS